MKLYLVRHGDALPKGQDPNRGLSDVGIAEVTSVAKFLSSADISSNAKVFHSSKKRAKQTASIISDVLKIHSIEEKDFLNPHDNPQIMFEEIIDTKEDTMLVGHLPYMEELLSLLVTGKTNISVGIFSTASIFCLEKSNTTDIWSIKWAVSPQLLLQYYQVD